MLNQVLETAAKSASYVNCWYMVASLQDALPNAFNRIAYICDPQVMQLYAITSGSSRLEQPYVGLAAKRALESEVYAPRNAVSDFVKEDPSALQGYLPRSKGRKSPRDFISIKKTDERSPLSQKFDGERGLACSIGTADKINARFGH